MKAFWGRNCPDNAAEFERLYRENYDYVFNYVSYRMAGSDEVEDIVAETFLKAAKAFDRFDSSRSKFTTWTVAIARNCMTDYWRRNKPKVAIDDVPESTFAAEDASAVFDDKALIRALLSELDDADRELVFMKYYGDMRNVDIARTLGMNESTIATRLQRAMVKMRSCAQRTARAI